MFDAIITAYNVIYSVIYYSYYVSLKCGQTIVTQSANLANNVVNFGLILLESLKIFLEDIYGTVVLIYGSFMHLFDVILGVIGDIGSGFSKIILEICRVYEVILNSPLAVIRVIRQLFVCIRDLIILIGAGVWFAITIVPLSLCYLTTSTAKLVLSLIIETFDKIKQCTETIKTVLYDLYYFVTDVPLESLAGLIVGLSIAYILFQFYVVIYAFLRARFTSYKQIIRQNCAVLYNNILQKITVRQRVIYRRILESRRPLHLRREPINRRVLVARRVIQQEESKNEDSFLDQRFCVICQERQKCILILPCRHVCLCSECNSQLQMYNNTCPMCRKDIERTMKVFV
ncbi:unnamed protein product [Brassicogethes aeneus]|uniref:RING-type domain-containing protein n=1 Tax=Brassicogethes aeneus TaxID=1431903 RepID=A0A9P0FAP0_BRAAE|nr:unnamed protein product [Brassicogethes aeneus]